MPSPGARHFSRGPDNSRFFQLTTTKLLTNECIHLTFVRGIYLFAMGFLSWGQILLQLATFTGKEPVRGCGLVGSL